MLKEIRMEKNITQESAANFLGISRRTYIKYENNKELQETFKGKYMIETLNKYGFIDEDHGLLTIDLIKEKCNLIFPKYDVYYCYLFGSYAKNMANENSDIDLLISMPLDGLKFYELVEVLREKLKKKVDLLDARHLGENKELLENILKEGIKIYG
jgi:hypothetical protein